MQLLREEIKVNPKSDAAWVEVGNIHMSKNDFIPAAIAYMHAAYNNEKNANALFGLGVVHRLKGSYDNALTLFERVLTLDRLKVEVYWQQGLALKAMNNKAKAIQAFTNYKGLTQDSAEKAKAEAMIRDLTVNK